MSSCTFSFLTITLSTRREHLTSTCVKCHPAVFPFIPSRVTEQLAALELEQAEAASEETSQLRWDLQEAQQTLLQRSSDYEVRPRMCVGACVTIYVAMPRFHVCHTLLQDVQLRIF